MVLDGNSIINNLKRMSQVVNLKQVKPLSYALFPGYHCPLMGAMMTINEIQNATMLVVGLDECAYYTKLATDGGTMKADGCEIVSIVLDQHDVTFGCQNKMDEAFAELMEEFSPKAVYMVTTCVVEVIGDDVDAMAEQYADEYGIPVIVVHAENFKTDDHLPGIEQTMDASIDIMEEQPIEDCVNILGFRLGNYKKSEVNQILEKSSVGIGMMLPGKSSVEEIRTAPKAKCNIVVHPVGLTLAEKMKKKFGTPYVVFERFTDPERIYQCYKKLYNALEKELPQEVVDRFETAQKKVEAAKPKLAGKTYISGNTALCNYEFHAFMASKLDVKPLLLQISELDVVSKEFRDKLMEHCDPYVTRPANISALTYVYPVLRPDFNIGPGGEMELRKNQIASIRMMRAYDTLGFEVTHIVIDGFMNALAETQMISANAMIPSHGKMKGGA